MNYNYKNKVIGAWLAPAQVSFLEELAATLNLTKAAALTYLVEEKRKGTSERDLYIQGANKLYKDFKKTYKYHDKESFEKFKGVLRSKLVKKNVPDSRIKKIIFRLEDVWLKK